MASVPVSVTAEGASTWLVTAAHDDVASIAAAIRTAGKGLLDADIVQDLLLVLHFPVE
jgi:hypothetical protein